MLAIRIYSFQGAAQGRGQILNYIYLRIFIGNIVTKFGIGAIIFLP